MDENLCFEAAFVCHITIHNCDLRYTWHLDYARDYLEYDAYRVIGFPDFVFQRGSPVAHRTVLPSAGEKLTEIKACHNVMTSCSPTRFSVALSVGVGAKFSKLFASRVFASSRQGDEYLR